MLASFHEAHPKIAVEIALSNRNQDLLRQEADIAVRMAEPTQQALLAKKIGDVRIGLFAHRRYLKHHGTPRDLDELVAKHALIGFDRDTSALRALRQTGLPITRDLFALRTDSDPAQFHALCAGFGVGACQVGAAVKVRELAPVLPEVFSFRLGMWLVMHEDLKTSRRVRLLFDHLAASLAIYAKIDRAGAP
jgi:DNA-binding transcriptional LysR family regulator